MNEPGTLLPLTGFTVGVTAARRAEELIALLERRGANVLHAPTIHLLPLSDDTQLLAATRACLQAPPDFVIATTGMGFRGWIEASDGWGLADGLLHVLARARVLARGPKAKGAVRAAGLREEWSPPSESSAEVLAHLLAIGVAAKRVVVQLHGEPQPDVVEALRGAGAEVIEVPVYRWELPKDTTGVRRMVQAVVDGTLDAITFTSAPAVTALLQVAEDVNLTSELVAALSSEVLAFAVGPVTAEPLLQRGVPVHVADRHRLGGLVHEVVEALPATGRRPRQ